MNYDVAKHLLHCVAMYGWIGVIIYGCVFAFTVPVAVHPIERYGLPLTIIIYAWKCLPLLIVLPCFFQLLGLTFFNPFRAKVRSEVITASAPFICFRVVTRGLFPRLVKANLTLNMDTCKSAGLSNFMFEVVTDNLIDINSLPLVREIVVPSTYKTKTGALFKARALHYCLEEGVSSVKDSQWIVHLDEETLLTENTVFGILNFVTEGKHDFGQGVITYASGEVVNWLTTLSDTYRVADDCAKLRASLSLLHKPIFGWKGSYVVTRCSAEKAIGWDHGQEGSICEDAYFAMLGMQDGHSFGFIQGEMHEQSPFTTMDLLKQRKRWLEGLLLTVYSTKIRYYHKIPLALVVYSWCLAPITLPQCVLIPLLQLPRNIALDSILASILAINIYMCVLGVILSFDRKKRNPIYLPIQCIGACIAMPYTVIIQAASVIMLLFGPKMGFHIVNKECDSVTSEPSTKSSSLSSLKV